MMKSTITARFQPRKKKDTQFLGTTRFHLVTRDLTGVCYVIVNEWHLVGVSVTGPNLFVCCRNY